MTFETTDIVGGIIGALLLAWFLSLFGFDGFFVGGINELFGIEATTNTYYLSFFFGGLLWTLFECLTKRKK